MPNFAKNIFLLLLAQSCVGINIVLSKGLIDHINPIIVITIRFSISTIFMSLILMRSEGIDRFKPNLTNSDWVVLLTKGICAGALFNILMLSGLYFTSANSAGLITSLLPAMIICLNIICFKQKLDRKMLVAIAISLIGLVFINFGLIGGNSRNALMGNLLVLLSLVPEGFYYTLSKYYPLKIHPVLNAVLLNASNLPFLCLIVLFMPASYWKVITWYDWLIISIIGLATGLFFICWEKGVQRVDATYAALSTAFMPLTTVIFSWLILGEGLSVSKFIGMLLVMLSIISYSRKQVS